MNHNAMLFDIEAELWAQPLPLRLFLRTEIDLETRGASTVLRDAGPGRRADGSAAAAVLQPRAAVHPRDGRRVRARVSRRSPAGWAWRPSSAPIRTSSGCSRGSPSSPRACSSSSTPSSRASPSTCWRSSTRTTWPPRRRWRWCSCSPTWARGSLAQGYRVPRGTDPAQRARPGRPDRLRVPHRPRGDAVAARDHPRRVHRLRR